MRKRNFKAINVMADFSCSGIWEAHPEFPPKKRGVGGMIEYEELKISKELIKEFEAWELHYDTCFKADYSTFKKGKAEKHNKWGKVLAEKLKKELPKTEICYWGEEPRAKPPKHGWCNCIKKIKIK
jgi:hypothetical protein